MPIRPQTPPPLMTETPASRRFAEIAQKWRDLVDRRCAQLVMLHHTGDWKRFYGETQFLRLMREAIALAETWSELAPRPPEGEREIAPAEPAADPRRSTAA